MNLRHVAVALIVASLGAVAYAGLPLGNGGIEGEDGYHEVTVAYGIGLYWKPNDDYSIKIRTVNGTDKHASLEVHIKFVMNGPGGGTFTQDKHIVVYPRVGINPNVIVPSDEARRRGIPLSSVTVSFGKHTFSSAGR